MSVMREPAGGDGLIVAGFGARSVARASRHAALVICSTAVLAAVQCAGAQVLPWFATSPRLGISPAKMMAIGGSDGSSMLNAAGEYAGGGRAAGNVCGASGIAPGGNVISDASIRRRSSEDEVVEMLRWPGCAKLCAIGICSMTKTRDDRLSFISFSEGSHHVVYTR